MTLLSRPAESEELRASEERLPLVRGVATPESRQAPGAAHQWRRILVVDDNRDSAAVLSDLLALLGHEVRQAYDGHAALQAVPEFRPHVVFLDIGLPDMDGNEVARRLRQLEAGREATIVAASGYAPARADATSDTPFDEYLVKPLDIAQLEALLSTDPGHVHAIGR